ncbi:MAG: hypothetical protein FRX48_07403 [Lasallia pustulata]|uniref:Uncharacterized protein n=1 Tax=Lasallia pustulata TaxID=136370 RepID=A0A5M8PI38_9LECA|nr:MAG: hypothetical protein FRX48_07403 [Lasallia pustulata]
MYITVSIHSQGQRAKQAATAKTAPAEVAAAKAAAAEAAAAEAAATEGGSSSSGERQQQRREAAAAERGSSSGERQHRRREAAPAKAAAAEAPAGRIRMGSPAARSRDRKSPNPNHHVLSSIPPGLRSPGDMTEKRADPATQLEIDEAILDYLLYTAIGAVLEDYRIRRSCADASVWPDRAGLPLQMVDSFLTVFHANHPNSPVSSTLQFRVRLLQFSVLFIRRSTARTSTAITATATSDSTTLPALRELRVRNRARSQVYLSHRPDARDIDAGVLLSSRPPMAEAALGTSLCSTSPALYASPTSVSLLDTLPAFMALSAIQNAMSESDITTLWMDLAARFMAQAALEQYVGYGAKEPDVLLDAFAWGYDASSAASEGSDDWEVNIMFSVEEGEVPEWARIRKHYIGMLLPPADMPLHTHFQKLLDGDLSPSVFQNLIAQFLDRLLDHQPEPLLVQLEKGRVEGLSGAQTQRLKRSVGFE